MKSLAFAELVMKLEEIKDYALAGRKGNAAVSYDAIERLTNEALALASDVPEEIRTPRQQEFDRVLLRMGSREL